MLALRLPEEIEQRLDDLAAKTGRTKTYYAREAVIEKLEEMEDYYLAVSRYEKFLKEGGKALSAEEVRKRLGLDD
jgi:RHH-type rel operon transcriptional repressor/antitoxin RelB